ncbi:OPT/YSL family transporter [Pseudomonas oryzihabitans]|uniref:OPT/YSL family transporter n=1 Tax=Pseudomonas oryzihabitans TaxID=47885 RepID=UPI0018D8E81F|nr:OPT family oligopeptide transporter [Pseudomonas oryzihabitans]MBH3331769.1 OPT/YSL family transporter [Pseudomonas oryzihabitans]
MPAANAAASDLPLPVERELSPRALLTGALLGILLTPANVYAGLKIGWSFNMSIIALLVSYGLWHRLQQPGWTLHESNINQTVASAAASIVSGGLVAPIPAYTLLTGQELPTLPLMGWVFAVSFLGIWVAWYLRPLLLADASLKFPEGLATLEALRQVYASGAEALARLRVLLGALALSAAVKLVDTFAWTLPRVAPSPALERLTFSFDPSLLLLGFGGIIGLRVGLSLLLGTLLAWGGVAPWLLASGVAALPAEASGPQYAFLVQWLLWPGVSLMVSATLAALAVRLITLPRAERRRQGWQRPRAWPLALLLAAALLVVVLQVRLFGIDPWLALLALPLALFLAAMAARVVGATGIPPIGAIGQLSQLTFGLAAPGQVNINLMGANTAGGAAGQSTDLMNDFKVGQAIGATPAKQVVAQCLGIALGAVTGVLTYRLLIPDPQALLLSAAWPAPAVAQWKAVAETLTQGLGALDGAMRLGIVLGALAGLLLGLAEALLPTRRAHWLPSSAALGLAFILPASVSLMMTLGALLTALVRWRAPGLAERFALAAAAGLIAGESLAGVGAAFWQMLST